MKKRIVFQLFHLLISGFILSFTSKIYSVKIVQIDLANPFVMPPFKVPDFSGNRRFSIVDFGAVPRFSTQK